MVRSSVLHPARISSTVGPSLPNRVSMRTRQPVSLRIGGEEWRVQTRPAAAQRAPRPCCQQGPCYRHGPVCMGRVHVCEAALPQDAPKLPMPPPNHAALPGSPLNVPQLLLKGLQAGRGHHPCQVNHRRVVADDGALSEGLWCTHGCQRQRRRQRHGAGGGAQAGEQRRRVCGGGGGGLWARTFGLLWHFACRCSRARVSRRPVGSPSGRPDRATSCTVHGGRLVRVLRSKVGSCEVYATKAKNAGRERNDKSSAGSRPC